MRNLAWDLSIQFLGHENNDVEWLNNFKKKTKEVNARDSTSTAVTNEESPEFNEAELENMSPNALLALAEQANKDELAREKCEKKKRRS